MEDIEGTANVLNYLLSSDNIICDKHTIDDNYCILNVSCAKGSIGTVQIFITISPEIIKQPKAGIYSGVHYLGPIINIYQDDPLPLIECAIKIITLIRTDIAQSMFKRYMTKLGNEEIITKCLEIIGKTKDGHLTMCRNLLQKTVASHDELLSKFKKYERSKNETT